jgi:flagellar L-ring protein precursor FlgH
MLRISARIAAAAAILAMAESAAVAQGIWGNQNLIADRKIRKYDLVTVVVREKSKTSTSTDTKTEEKADLDTAVTKWFNVEGSLAKPKTQKADSANLPAAAGSHDRKRDNEGEINQSSTFEARLTARIIEILPNGDVVIEARKTVTVGEEESTLIFTGEVRRQDIKDDNTVESDRVADAQIIYKGRGVVTDANRRGWLARVFDFLNVF